MKTEQAEHRFFHPSSNTLLRLFIAGTVLFAAFGGWIWYELNKSPFVTRAGIIEPQPVMFSHKHHVSDDGIDCRVCHTSVEKKAFAGMPTTETCMKCHSELYTESEMLAPVRVSYKTGVPLRWTRVHNLPRFVYFNHSIHVAKGVGCATCHGRVDKMSMTFQQAPLTMEWCLSCHRAPENFIRPREEVFNMEYSPPENQKDFGIELKSKYGIKSSYAMTNCSICHR